MIAPIPFGAKMWKVLVTIWILGAAVSGIEVLDTFKIRAKVVLFHDLKSGPIELLDTKNIKIPNLHYNRTSSILNDATDTFWIVGYGTPPTQNPYPFNMPGFVIPNEKGNCDKLPMFHDGSIQLVLPGDFTVNNVDWLAMYDITDVFTTGWIDFREKRNGNRFKNVVEAPADTVLPKLCKQRTQNLGIFAQKEGITAHGLDSDPIHLINIRTFLIPNLHYDGTCPDAYWMVGNGEPPDTRPEKTPGHQIPNEAGSCDALKKYSGQTVQLVLPDKFTVDNIDWLAMYCITEKHTLGYLDLQMARTEIKPKMSFLDLTPLPPNIIPPKPCGDSKEQLTSTSTSTSTESKEVGGGGDGSGQSKLSGSGLILLAILVPVYLNWALHF